MRQDAIPLEAPAGILICRLHVAKDVQIVAQLTAMEKKLWKKAESWGPDLEKELKRRNTFALYATTATLPSSPPSSASVLGYILYTTNGLVSHISKVIVAPAARRQGIGRALVKASIEISQKERRVGSVTLHVDADNIAALGLYKSFGFNSEGAMLEVGSTYGLIQDV